MSSKAWKRQWPLLYPLLGSHTGIISTQICQKVIPLWLNHLWCHSEALEPCKSQEEATEIRRKRGLHSDLEIVLHIKEEPVSKKNRVKPIHMIFDLGQFMTCEFWTLQMY